MEVEYRNAEIFDLTAIVAFVDFWLTGGGVADGVPGAGHDFFVPYGRHKAYLEKYQVLLAIYGGEIVGWSVKSKKGVLIHLLVAGTFRGNGIGGEMLRRMSPEVIRSKSDQSTGDPAQFYLRKGYIRASSERLGKKKNIELFVEKEDIKDRDKKSGFGREMLYLRSDEVENGPRLLHHRNIDILAKKLHLGNFHLG